MKFRQWTDRNGVKWFCDAYDHGPMCRQCKRVDGESVNMTTLAMTDAQVHDLLFALNYAVSAKELGYHVGAAFKTLNLCREQGVVYNGERLD